MFLKALNYSLCSYLDQSISSADQVYNIGMVSSFFIDLAITDSAINGVHLEGMLH